MLRALKRLIGLDRPSSQLSLELEAQPRDPVDRGVANESSARRAPERTHPEDSGLAERLRRAHDSYNREKFGGVLTPAPIRVSRRMKSRLGHYTHRGPAGGGGEIVISRRHIRRHGWAEVMDTLVHEMVHQWQDEGGLTVDHGRQFRAKARAVGISPRARRDVA
jgi:SprT-like family